MKLYTNKKILASVSFAILLGGGACYFTVGKEDTPAEASVVQNVPVVVKTVTKQKVRVWSEFSGRLHAVDSAEIRPEVSGRITEVNLEDGGFVNKGDILFVIDPRPYEAIQAKAEANLITAKTNASFAKVEMDRAAGMMQTKAIAQRIFDERANADRVALAAVKSAEAELAQANLDVEHAHIRSPISGRVSRAELTVGNLVQAGANAPLLTAVVASGAIYADFEVDEQTYMQSIRNLATGSAQEKQIPVEISVAGDKEHPHVGTIYSFDNRLDIASGTIRARAKFNNDNATLVPGMFVSVKLASSSDDEALLVPEVALGFDQSKQFVLVVGQDNKVAYREVVLGKEVQSQRIVLSGLTSGERVIVEGMQHVRPEAVVDAKEVE